MMTNPTSLTVEERQLFHVSRSSDGEAEWFSIRDAASGVTFRAPDQNRKLAHDLAGALNRAVAGYLRDQLTSTDRLRDALEPFAKADIDVSGTAAIGVTADDILRARAALTSTPAPSGEREARKTEAAALLLRAFNVLLVTEKNDPLESIADNGMTVWDGIRNAVAQLKPDVRAYFLRWHSPDLLNEPDLGGLA